MPENQLAGCRVFVCEDEPLAAVLLKDFLEEAGCTIVGPYATKDEALAVARSAEVDAALLDINLRDGRVYPVAQILSERNIPFLLLTGYDADDTLPDRSWPLFGKPFHGEQLIMRFQELLAHHSGRDESFKRIDKKA